MTEKKPLIVIAGPTAVGKSDMAAETARRIDGEVVSADSMQVYRYMDIGSAKVTYEEMLGVPHHMIDVKDPHDPMDVSEYAEMASKCIREIHERGHVPILCGGTGFYIQAVTRGIDFGSPAPDEAYRKELTAYAEQYGDEALHSRLREVDPEAAEEIHMNNRKRVIRALEYYRAAGRCISEHNEEEKKKESPYDLLFFVLTDDRERLYRRIDRRVDFMMEAGLPDEIAYLQAMGLKASDVSMQGIGYKEILRSMDGEMSMEEAVRIIKRDSRHYAKRQLTWFRREPGAIWLNRQDYGDDSGLILQEILRIIKERLRITAKAVRDPHT